MGNQIMKADVLEQNVEEILEMIIGGTHYRDIAHKYDVSLYTLFKFIHSEKHSVQMKEAKQFAAHILVEEVEKMFVQAKEDPRLFPIAVQLGHHYRWKAAKIYGQQYGERTYKPEELESGKKQITVKVIRDGGNN